MEQVQPFVRNELFQSVIDDLRKRHSVKLIGIPGIGISTLIRHFAAATRRGGDLAKDFFALSYATRYDMGSFVDQTRNSLAELANLSLPRLEPHNLLGYLIAVRDLILNRVETKQVIFIFDDFEHNFATHSPNSLLTLDNLKSLRALSETDGRVQFIVTYTHPVDLILNEDWYLVNFETSYVHPLEEAEARDLVIGRWLLKHGHTPTDAECNAILAFGGRYPPTLQLACDDWYTRDDRRFKEHARKICTHLAKYIQETDTIIQSAESSLSLLREIARSPLRDLQQIEDPRFLFAKHFCYLQELRTDQERQTRAAAATASSTSARGKERSSTRVVSPQVECRILAGVFGEYLIRTEVTHAAQDKGLRKQVAILAAMALLSALLLPFSYTICLYLVQLLLHRPLFIPEYDLYALRPQHLINLGMYFKLPALISSAPVCTAAIWVVERVFKHGRRLSFSMPLLRGSVTEKIEAFHLWAPGLLLTLNASLFVTGFLIALFAPDYDAHFDEHLRATIVHYQSAKNETGSKGYSDTLRRVYVNDAFISCEQEPDAYLLVTPLILTLPDNFRSALRSSGQYLRECWTETLGPAKTREALASRLQHILGGSRASELRPEYKALWTQDHKNHNFDAILSKVTQLQSGSDLSARIERFGRDSPQTAFCMQICELRL